jgi:UDP-N-acetylglucosamine 2-epimerase
LLCPTATALENAKLEGLGNKSYLTGDVMLDLLLKCAAGLDPHELAKHSYALVTVHRAENTDSPARMGRFVKLLERLPLTVILPMHPRLRAKLPANDLEHIERLSHVRVLEPCGYVEMLALERHACMILTDSGGVQKEAYFLGVPCLTLRTETEWKETLAGGWNRVVGMNPDVVLPVVDSLLRRNRSFPKGVPNLEQFGSGGAGEASVKTILNSLRGESQ